MVVLQDRRWSDLGSEQLLMKNRVKHAVKNIVKHAVKIVVKNRVNNVVKSLTGFYVNFAGRESPYKTCHLKYAGFSLRVSLFRQPTPKPSHR